MAALQLGIAVGRVVELRYGLVQRGRRESGQLVLEVAERNRALIEVFSGLGLVRQMLSSMKSYTRK